MSKSWEDMTEIEQLVIKQQSVHLADMAKRALAVDRVYIVTSEYGVAVNEHVTPDEALRAVRH